MSKEPLILRCNESVASLYCADALNVLESVEPSSVAMMLTSPPYCIGKEYEQTKSLDAFINEFDRTINAIIEALKPGGAACWQVGNHIHNGEITPLDAIIISRLQRSELKLRNRIVWSFGHGAHAKLRFSGRHETIVWFSKGEVATFDLDAVRVPQKYPGKRHYKGPQRGEFSGNPLGKNPGDVWDIPNVKSRHPEKTAHPCQFPVALAQRLVRALTIKGETVLDPYMGSGTTAIASLSQARNFIGCDLEQSYFNIAKDRISSLIDGDLPVRPDLPPREPTPDEAAARKPSHFWNRKEEVADARGARDTAKAVIHLSDHKRHFTR